MKTKDSIFASFIPTADSTSQIIGFSATAYDKDFNIGMGINSIHIQPVSNGFIVNMRTKEDGLKIHCFQKFEELLDMLKDCGIMTLDNEKIAENI